MAVSTEFRAFVIESLGRVAPAVTGRSMFGGVGVYSAGVFFALIAGETLYLKVDDTTRGDFEAIGTGLFIPSGRTRRGCDTTSFPPTTWKTPTACAPGWRRPSTSRAAPARRSSGPRLAWCEVTIP